MEVIYTRYSYIFYLTAYEGFGSAALVVLTSRAGTVRFCPRSCPDRPFAARLLHARTRAFASGPQRGVLTDTKVCTFVRS